jgi:hypothetical protein
VRVATFVLVTGHLLLAAGWIGAMGYSLAVVQPRVLRHGGSPREAEELATFLAAGARWKVVGIIAALAATGGLLVVLGAASEARGAGWWGLVAAKAGLLALASVVFWYVSWRMWPRRLFALPDEVAGWQRAFRVVGAVLLTLVGLATVLGVALRWA